jgi:hypothetical protein
MKLRTVDIRNAYRITMGNNLGSSQLVQPRRRWENNTKEELKQVACEGVVGWSVGYLVSDE